MSRPYFTLEPSAGLALKGAKAETFAEYGLIVAGEGAPSGAGLWTGAALSSGQQALYFRTDAADIDAMIYATVDGGTTWTALTITDGVFSSLIIPDSGTLAWGTAGADVVITADGTDAVMTGTGDFVVADAVGFAIGTGKDIVLTPDGTDVVVSGAGDLVFADSVGLVLGTGKDDTIIHNATDTVWTHSTGNLDLDNAAATGATYVTLGADTSAVEFAVRNDSEARSFIVDGAGDVTIGGATTNKINLTGQLAQANSATSTGLVVEQVGTSATEGWRRVIYEDTISPAAVETAVLTVPAGSVVEGVWANVETALTGGGTTVTWSLGISAGDLDGFGTATSDGYISQADALTQNSKFTCIDSAVAPTNAGALIGLFSANSQAIVLTGTATGGTAAGDTELTVGSIRIRVQYRTALPMDNAA